MQSAIGVRLEPYEGNADDLLGRYLGMELSLSTAAHLEDDRELDFTHYAHLLSTRVAAPRNRLLLYQLQSTAIAALALLLNDGVHDGMLTCGVQTLLARYTTDGDAIDDAVSGKQVELPEHFVDLNQRLAR